MTWADQVTLAAFNNLADAQAAVSDLEKEGFNDEQVGIAYRDATGKSTVDVQTIERDHESGGALGAGAGALLGTVVGAAAAVAFPPAAAIVAAGALVGLVTGAVTGGLMGALTGMGIPKAMAEYYQREIDAGKSIVVVMCEGREQEAVIVLRRHGGFQFDESGAVIVVPGSAVAAGNTPTVVVDGDTRTSI